MKKSIILFLCAILSVSCSNENETPPVIQNPVRNLSYLALGDSYTIGQSVCESCRFPAQLQDSIKNYLSSSDNISLKIVAQTGWTTTNLKTAIATENLNATYDLVTLLIGVNNQYQNKPFELYETEFQELLQTAITLAKGNSNHVIVVSIPDYAFTPFGQSGSNPENISNQLDNYNLFAKNHAESLGVTFVNITDITREGLNNPALVASDNLHPSELAYTKFVERLLPFVKQKINLP
ncbi:MAG: SGNH/GDSL hydrolase family protein [Flavobacterium sp.]|nr:SGNH/GDSL hydrolase family protein [Flavobacterium sp.]